jgi:hypothetical protein
VEIHFRIQARAESGIMIVTITSLRLKSLWGFFRLSWNGLKITLQARKSPGFVAMKNTGSGYLHYTMSLWKEEKDAQAFARSGAHLEAMKKGGELAEEICVHTYAAEALPAWGEAKVLVEKHGRRIAYR